VNIMSLVSSLTKGWGEIRGIAPGPILGVMGKKAVSGAIIGGTLGGLKSGLWDQEDFRGTAGGVFMGAMWGAGINSGFGLYKGLKPHFPGIGSAMKAGWGDPRYSVRSGIDRLRNR
jgi:hypothetical protein